MGLQDAQDLLQSQGSYLLDQQDASGLGRLQMIDSNWKVCTQSPAPGSSVGVQSTVQLGAVKLDESCPGAGGSPAAQNSAAAEAAGTMPDVVGMVLQDAQDTLQAKGSYLMDQVDATGQGRFQLLDSNWKVCDQAPAAGEALAATTLVRLSAVKLGDVSDDSLGCPCGRPRPPRKAPPTVRRGPRPRVADAGCWAAGRPAEPRTMSAVASASARPPSAPGRSRSRGGAHARIGIDDVVALLVATRGRQMRVAHRDRCDDLPAVARVGHADPPAVDIGSRLPATGDITGGIDRHVGEPMPDQDLGGAIGAPALDESARVEPSGRLPGVERPGRHAGDLRTAIDHLAYRLGCRRTCHRPGPDRGHG
jgi:hypothetical protein